MSTHGAYGFRLNNKDYVTYNHYDSYPTHLCHVLIDEINNLNLSNPIVLQYAKDQISKLKLVSPFEFEDIEEISEKIRGNGEFDGDCSIKHYINGFPIMADHSEFLKDSLFCEWAYIVNLDTETLEIYVGGNRSDTKMKVCGRYAKEKIDRNINAGKNLEGEYFDYLGVKLIASVPFKTLTEINVGQFCYDVKQVGELPEDDPVANFALIFYSGAFNLFDVKED